MDSTEVPSDLTLDDPKIKVTQTAAAWTFRQKIFGLLVYHLALAKAVITIRSRPRTNIPE